MSGLGEQDDEAAAYGDLEQERAFWQFKSEELADWVMSRRPQVRKAMSVLSVRCPNRGCLLGQVYKFLMKPEPPPEFFKEMLRSTGRAEEAEKVTAPARYIWIGTTVAGVRKVGILNWAFSDDWRGPKWYVPAGCSHGVCRIVFAWAMDCVGLTEGWHHALETLEASRASAPIELQRGISRRTFHPEAKYWRATTGRPPRSGRMFPEDRS